MDETIWTPRCRRPDDLVPPVRLDRSGVTGPTPGQARGPFWHRCGPRLYVPAGRPTHVEQRILEQGRRVDPARGAVTGWAALRWHGAAYFDGRGRTGSDELPVPLLVSTGGARPHPGSEVRKTQLPAYDRVAVAGLWVTTVARALFDEVVRRRPDLWESVTAIAMTFAADLITPADFAAYVTHRCAWEGVPHVREASAIARPDLWSPREVWLDLVWRLDAGLPLVPANRPVFARDGTFLGIPDLLDPVAGLAVEYDGAHHLRAVQRRADLERESLMRRHGLEYVSVVGGDTRDAAAARILDARTRARFAAPSDRGWTLETPEWWLARHPSRRPAG